MHKNGKCNVNEGNNSVYKENKKSEAVFVSNKRVFLCLTTQI